MKTKPTAITNFQNYDRDLDMSQKSELAKVYSDNIMFKDPIHKLSGLENLHQYFSGMNDNVLRCTFDFHKESIDEGFAYLEWVMELETKSSKRLIVVPGVTYVEFDEKITKHVDYFDAGALFYENIPILNKVIAFIKRKIVS